MKISGLLKFAQRINGLSVNNIAGSIGIDLAMEEMHLVQLEKQKEKITLRSHVSVAYPGSRDEILSSLKTFKLFFKNALKQGKFTGNKIVTALPADKVRVMSITYPHNNVVDKSQSIIKVLQDRLSSDLSEYIIDYLPVRGNEKDSNYLAIVAIARREIVLSYLDYFHQAGLKVEALEIGPSAIKRLVTSMAGHERTRNVMVINFGQKMSYLTILSGRRLMFDQEIEFGEQVVLDRVATMLDMLSEEARKLIYKNGIEPGGVDVVPQSDVDVAQTLSEIAMPLFMSLVEEINRVLIYTAAQTRGEPVSLIYLTGSIARWKGADAILRSILNIDVETIPNPLSPYIGDDRVGLPMPVQGSPELAVATGLALRGVINE